MKLVQASNDPDKILTTPTEPVEDFSEVPAIELKLRTTIRLNTDIHGNPDLIGLAANQIGIKKAVTVILTGQELDDLHWLTMVNPWIRSESDTLVTEIEGCGSLRLPEPLLFKVTRPDKVTVMYQDVNGNLTHIDLEGWDARVAQHEIDHLNGILISDHGTPVNP